MSETGKRPPEVCAVFAYESAVQSVRVTFYSDQRAVICRTWERGMMLHWVPADQAWEHAAQYAPPHAFYAETVSFTDPCASVPTDPCAPLGSNTAGGD